MTEVSGETPEAVVISTLESKAVIAVALLLVVPLASGNEFYYGDNSGSSYTTDNGFSIPQYDSQQELISQLIAPFIFLTILLQIAYSRALRLIFVDDQVDLVDLVGNNRPPQVRRQSIMLALATTGILVPTPFWQYVRWAVGSIGLISITLVLAGAILLAYWFFKG